MIIFSPLPKIGATQKQEQNFSTWSSIYFFKPHQGKKGTFTYLMLHYASYVFGSSKMIAVVLLFSVTANPERVTGASKMGGRMFFSCSLNSQWVNRGSHPQLG